MDTPKYRHEVSTNDLREAVAQAGDFMTELLIEVLTASNDQTEKAATTELGLALIQYLEDYQYPEVSSDPQGEQEDFGEIVE